MMPLFVPRSAVGWLPMPRRIDALSVLACLLMVSGLLWSGASMAQTINARWMGTWQNEQGPDKLVVTDRQFNVGSTACRWSATVARQVKQCHAYYEGTITRTQIQQQLDESDKQAQTIIRQGADAKTTKAIQEQFRRNKQVMARISNDTFRLIQTNTPDKEMGSGDCGDVFFLDKESVYQLMQCAPAPEAFTLNAYRKTN